MANKIDEKLAKGYIHFNAILEIVGKPKEHVESTFLSYINEIKQNEKFEIVSTNIESAIKVDGSENLFSSFAELEVVVKDLGTVLDFCSECMPASIEIVGPSEMKLRANEASAAVNTLIGRIHEVDMQAKQMTQQSELLIQNLRIALKNAILIYLAQKPRTTENISTAVGVNMQQLPALLKNLIAENKIVEVQTNIYAIAGASVTHKPPEIISQPATTNIIEDKSSKKKSKKRKK